MKRAWPGWIVSAGLLGWIALASANTASAAGNVQRGAVAFRVCSACHSLRPGLNMTGPSLANVWHRKAGGLASLGRYSPALKASGVVWNAATLDAWLKSPAQFIPGNQAQRDRRPARELREVPRSRRQGLRP